MNSLSNPEASSPAEFWHTQPEADLLLKLEATSKGLSKQEAQLRLKTHGPNQLPQAEPPAWWIIAIRQFVKGRVNSYQCGGVKVYHSG